ncbi:MAG: uracil-DNA glycosylase [Polaromonas sp.]|nr:uracil-DNA glycosylase [Polaromonas sp.]MDP2452041.1 uracil-DNA glycosylase [Polaromonas sp.]MDP3250251.1 uracil-DNA glycosylase [Polaromonas sp.]MDP3757280.1 uracil-DNA glycosylase [Polaromonas sp.]MDP3826217.1 uracil-DNA glycosylase [Polaromonas sp.]
MDLDKRQRAMLREMGVRLWQPPPAAGLAPVADAIHTVAVDARPKRAEGRFDAEAEPARAPAPAAAPAVRPVPAQAPVSRPAPGLQPRPAGVELMDWPALQAAVAGCRACALCESRKNTVFGIGPTAADGAAPQVDWLIVGEAPGENEDIAGEPFVGQAGKLLDNMLLAIGLQRGQIDATAPRAGVSTSVFITNVLKCRPPANRNPDPAEVAQCEPYLKRQVELLQPKMILALGKFAAQSLLQDSVPELQKIPLGKLRGQVFHYLGVPVVVSYHPAYLLRSLGDKAKAWDDLCLAMSVAPTVVRSA